MQLHVHPGDELPIYRQIVRQITDSIAGGHLATGDKLPSHRDLAERLVIAPLTVKKAYDELEREGLIETVRGRGTFVSARADRVSRGESLEALRDPARRLLSQAALRRVSLEDLIGLLTELHKEIDR